MLIRENCVIGKKYGREFFRAVTLVLFAFVFIQPLFAATASSKATISEVVSEYRQTGSSPSLVKRIEALIDQYEIKNKDAEYFQLLDILFSSYVDQQQSIRAVELLNENRQTITAIDDVALRKSLLFNAGKLEYQLGRYGNAEEFFIKALNIAANDTEYTALVKNEIALVYIADEQFSRAGSLFEQAASALETAGNNELQIKIALNRGKLALRMQRYSEVFENLRIIHSLLDATDFADHKEQWLALGRQYQLASQAVPARADMRLNAYNIFSKLLAVSKDPVRLSYLYGYIGALYEAEGRYDEAMSYTRQALFQSQSIPSDELTYQWQWQIARLHRQLGQKSEALANLRSAVNTLSSIRSIITLNHDIDFATQVSPLYYQLAQALLDQSSETRSSESAQPYLKEVIDTLELMKTAEVENYFDSECVVLPDNKVNLTDIDRHVAVLYPLILPDKLELILQTPGQIKRYSVAVNSQKLSKEILDFRTRIENYRNDETYKHPAQNLYKLIIKPIEPDLKKQNIDTLVFIPDGQLRTIPISALHDGTQFLIQKYAVATTPGATLMDPKPLSRRNVEVLANGLVEAVQGYPALPSVKKEIEEIAKVFPTERNIDGQFQLQQSLQKMSAEKYSIVHFATHGEFSHDHSKSFLLTYDNKLTMNRLENSISLRRYNTEPLELLVLSACQTAVGDDQAALGLAGVALKAGARSALATLWFINDQSTTELITRFYQQLRVENMSKAKALQLAQVDLITNTRFKHPSLWAPFLMIGNWM